MVVPYDTSRIFTRDAIRRAGTNGLGAAPRGGRRRVISMRGMGAIVPYDTQRIYKWQRNSGANLNGLGAVGRQGVRRMRLRSGMGDCMVIDPVTGGRVTYAPGDPHCAASGGSGGGGGTPAGTYVCPTGRQLIGTQCCVPGAVRMLDGLGFPAGWGNVAMQCIPATYVPAPGPAAPACPSTAPADSSGNCCYPPNTLTSGVCTVPCPSPNTIVNGVCTGPTPTPTPSPIVSTCAAPNVLDANGNCVAPASTASSFFSKTVTLPIVGDVPLWGVLSAAGVGAWLAFGGRH